MRKKILIAIRWFSIPLAAFVAIAPVRSAIGMADRYSGKVQTVAVILESELRRAGTRGSGAEYDLYIRYPIENGRIVESNIRVMGDIFRSLRPGKKLTVFVDPKTHQAEDDLRLDSYFWSGLGALGAVVLFLLGFVATGRVLRTL